jgi:hypothetical protein
MKKALLLTFALPVAFGTAYAATTLPSVSVSGVTATSPVVTSTPNIAVSATVTSAFDTSSPPTANTQCSSCNNGNSFCGTNNNSIKTQKVVTTTTTTVGNTNTSAAASDPYNPSTGLTGSGTTFLGSLVTPTSGTDGTTTVTVAANVSEDVTTAISTDTSYWSAASCGGSQVGSTTTTSTTSGPVLKTGSGTGSGSYVLDINPPTLTLRPVGGQSTVLQGENKNIHNVLIAGSAGTSYTLTDTATGPFGYTTSADGSGTFGPGKDGIAPDAHDTVGVHIACDAPVGDYTATAVANTVDLGLNPFDPISSVDTPLDHPPGYAQDAFTVEPGISLEDQTQVVSELPPSGDYAPMSCFTSTTAKNGKVNTFPGSLHITATVNTTGPCAGFGTISGTVITLTLPAGFKFDVSGASPAAHVFVGPAASGFDFHYPVTLAEVTSLIPKPVVLGQTVTVDLSGLNLGQGAGVIPSSDTIYVRAHSVFSGSSLPADGTQYVFLTSTTSNLEGIGGSTTNSSSQTLTALSTCVNGN